MKKTVLVILLILSASMAVSQSINNQPIAGEEGFDTLQTVVVSYQMGEAPEGAFDTLQVLATCYQLSNADTVGECVSGSSLEVTPAEIMGQSERSIEIPQELRETSLEWSRYGEISDCDSSEGFRENIAGGNDDRWYYCDSGSSDVWRSEQCGEGLGEEKGTCDHGNAFTVLRDDGDHSIKIDGSYSVRNTSYKLERDSENIYSFEPEPGREYWVDIYEEDYDDYERVAFKAPDFDVSVSNFLAEQGDEVTFAIENYDGGETFDAKSDIGFRYNGQFIRGEEEDITLNGRGLETVEIIARDNAPGDGTEVTKTKTVWVGDGFVRNFGQVSGWESKARVLDGWWSIYTLEPGLDSGERGDRYTEWRESDEKWWKYEERPDKWHVYYEDVRTPWIEYEEGMSLKSNFRQSGGNDWDEEDFGPGVETDGEDSRNNWNLLVYRGSEVERSLDFDTEGFGIATGIEFDGDNEVNPSLVFRDSDGEIAHEVDQEFHESLEYLDYRGIQDHEFIYYNIEYDGSTLTIYAGDERVQDSYNREDSVDVDDIESFGFRMPSQGKETTRLGNEMVIDFLVVYSTEELST